MYCGEEEQRLWLSDTLRQERLTLCPKKGRDRRAKDSVTVAKADERISVANAAGYRFALSTGPIRRISTMKSVTKARK